MVEDGRANVWSRRRRGGGRRNRRRVWIAALGLLVVAIASLWFFTDPSEERCTAGKTVVVPGGSCAQVFIADDVVEGRLVITAFSARKADRLDLRYRYRNETPVLRSVDWRLVTAKGPGGDRVNCWGDDSAYRYEAPPGSDLESYGACEFRYRPGEYELAYDGVPVATVTVP